MAQSAMSPITWDGKREPHSCKWEEWLLFEDELGNKKAHHPSLNLTKHEIAEQILHDIEDLGRNCTGDWLDEFPLFDELQTLNPAEEPDNEWKTGNHNPKLDHQQQVSPNDESVAAEIHKHPPINQDLLSVSYENALTFILSNEKILFINEQPYVSLSPLQQETNKCEEEKISGKEERKNKEEETPQPELFCPGSDTPDVKTEMEVVDEIIRNTALELDQWESDSSRSEVSSDGTSVSDSSRKEKEDETDDPDWKPDTSRLSSAIRCKPYWRGGNQEEKKLRKKEQNKNAATRYRLKKKKEVKEILREEELLKEKKAKLEEKVDDIQKEIKCLKRLMRDLYKAKGMID